MTTTKAHPLRARKRLLEATKREAARFAKLGADRYGTGLFVHDCEPRDCEVVSDLETCPECHKHGTWTEFEEGSNG